MFQAKKAAVNYIQGNKKKFGNSFSFHAIYEFAQTFGVRT